MVEIVVAVGAVVGLGALAVIASSPKDGRAQRVLGKMCHKTIAETEDGELVKLVGRLTCEDAPLRAPLTARSCAFFHALVKYTDIRRYLPWDDALTEERDHCQSFWIEDSTGRALVELVNPQILVKMDLNFQTGLLQKPTPHMREFLKRKGESAEGLMFNRALRYQEGVLEEGEVVAVYGVACWEPDPDPTVSFAPGGPPTAESTVQGAGYRNRPLRLRIVDPPGGEMLISNKANLLGADEQVGQTA